MIHCCPPSGSFSQNYYSAVFYLAHVNHTALDHVKTAFLAATHSTLHVQEDTANLQTLHEEMISSSEPDHDPVVQNGENDTRGLGGYTAD